MQSEPNGYENFSLAVKSVKHYIQHDRFIRSVAGRITSCLDVQEVQPQGWGGESRLEQRSRAMQEQLSWVTVNQHIKGYE